MKTDEFLNQLKNSQSKIALPSSELSAPRSIRYAFHNSLMTLLPKGTVVDGVELCKTERSGKAWTGQTEWLLLIDHHLLHLVGTVEEHGQERRITVSHEFLPLAAFVRASVVTDNEENNQVVYLRSAKLTLAFTHTTFTANAVLPAQEVNKLLAFSQRLFAAVR